MSKQLYVLFLGLAAAIAPARAELITLAAPSAASGSFDVAVDVTGVFDSPHDTDFLLGYGFDVSFDSSKLSFLGETAGPLFDDLSGNPGISAQVAGVASAILLAPGDFVEPLELAVLHFTTTGLGPTTITITGDPSNLDQGLIYLSASDPISAAASLVATPEPGSAWLLSFAAVAISGVLWNRRRTSRLSN